MQVQVFHDSEAVLKSLLEVGVNLSVLEDRREMLSLILQEARKLTRSEAGTLYVLTGKTLQFVACQNDAMDTSVISQKLLGRELDIGGDSLAGFVARSGQILNIADSYALPAGAPFRINRDFDSLTGYRTESILAIPLMRPEKQCVGVLELINHLGPAGRITPFPEDKCSGIASLASVAAVTIHNSLLQEQLKQAQLDCIIRLSVAAEFRDDNTADHIRRISRSSALIAAAMNMPKDFVEMIQAASPMHDIGKIGIPDAILLKPGPLTRLERQLVQKHTLIGADILADPPNALISMAREVALTHHERWDGNGYPCGLSGEEIPLSGRIVGLADVFDALVSERCYKEPIPMDESLEIIRRENGKHFDPAVTEAFFSRLDILTASYGPADHA